MARKPATRVEFTLFDAVYEDGSQRIIEEQDRLIAERSGTPAVAVKSVHRSGSKKADDPLRSSRYASASD